MTWFCFWLLIGVVGILLTLVMVKPARVFEYPYFMAATFGVFILPQAVSLLRFPGDAPESAITSVLLTSCLCVSACWLGYQLPINRRIAYHAARRVNSRRLFDMGVGFIVIAYFFTYLISKIDPAEMGEGSWTGRVTIYGFFTLLVFPGFAIALRTALRARKMRAWLAAAAAAVLPLKAALFAGRREGTALFALTIALVLFFDRRKAPPRLVLVLVLAATTLVIPATGTYRTLVTEGGLEALRQLNLVENFREYLNEESILELRNAAMVIEAARRSGEREFGKGYWDQLVFRFVPAQLVGKELKDKLMFRSSEERLSGEIRHSEFIMSRGSTLTGMADSFQQFGYFGCLFFAVVAVGFRALWSAANQENAMFAQLFYIQLTTSAMRAVTHQTADFLPALAYNMVFLGVAFLYARERPMRRPLRVRRHRRSQPGTVPKPASEPG